MPILSHMLRNMVTILMKMEIIIPIIGAKKMKSTVLMMVSFSTTFDQEMVRPLVIMAWAMAAPANPPIRVWEEDDGIPYHQVSRFQNIAAINPARITLRVINSLLTVLLMVLATAWSWKMK